MTRTSNIYRKRQSSSAAVTRQLRKLFGAQAFMTLAGSTGFLPPASVFLNHCRKETFESVASAVRDIASAGIKPVFHPRELDFFFGPLWAGHALHAEPVFWYKKLHEPDLTQLMARAMVDEASKTGRYILCHCFVRSLCRCVGQKADPYVPSSQDKITVRAEECVDNGGRIDLLFSWGKGQETKIVAVEVKFGAKLDNPLENYSAHCQKLLRDEGSSSLLQVLLHAKQLKAEEMNIASNGQWHTVFWQQLLPIWESELAQTIPPAQCANCLQSDGTRMRNSLFTKVYG